jgi:uncharacterized protein (DUF1015 family)
LTPRFVSAPISGFSQTQSRTFSIYLFISERRGIQHVLREFQNPIVILRTIFEILNLNTPENVKFVAGSKGLKALQELAKQENGIAFVFTMAPVIMTQFFAVPDEGDIMLLKSTWFLSKLATGWLRD